MKETQHSITLLSQGMARTNPNRAESSNAQANLEEAPSSGKTVAPMHDSTTTEKTFDKDRFPRKLELPIVDGEGADSLIFRAERYYNINHLSQMEKLEAVGVCFEGEAQAWLRFEEREKPFESWENLKIQISTVFAGLKDGSLLNRPFVVKQRGTIAKYRAQFEYLAASV